MAKVKDNGYATWSLTGYSIQASNVSGLSGVTVDFATATHVDTRGLTTLVNIGSGVMAPSFIRTGIWTVGVKVKWMGTPSTTVYWGVKFDNNPASPTSNVRTAWESWGLPAWGITSGGVSTIPERAGCIMGYYLTTEAIKLTIGHDAGAPSSFDIMVTMRPLFFA